MISKLKANTPVMKQFFEVKVHYSDAIVLFRMGDFYETFLEDAVITSKILGIVLTKRANGKAADVDLAGFPYHSLDNYLPKLVQAGYRVAICEQIEDSQNAKGIVRREVIEVVTPGTLTLDTALNEKTNRYIGSLYIARDRVGFSYLDSSTGEFNVGECEKNDLKNTIAQFNPKEIVISNKIVYSNLDWYIEFHPFITQIEDQAFNFEVSYKTLIKHFKLKSLKSFGCENIELGISAAGALIQYLKNNLSIELDHLCKMTPVVEKGFMGIDAFSLRNLEIFQSLSNQEGYGTLIKSIDETITAGGGRLLVKNVIKPLTNKKEIVNRLDTVEKFVNNPNILHSIRDALYKSFDLQRILGKVNKSKASPRDLLAVGTTLDLIPKIKKFLKSMSDDNIEKISESFCETNFIVEKIFSMLDDNPSINLSKGDVIKKGVDAELDELRELRQNGKKWISNYQNKLRQDLGIAKLKIGFNKIFGYFIEVTKIHQEKVPTTFTRKQTLVNSERFITDELKKYEEKIFNAETRIFDIEFFLFNQVCKFILKNAELIQNNANMINYLDLITSFSFLARKSNYVKPLITEERMLDIKKARHPVIEKLMPSTEKFIPNDLLMDARSNQIHLLTGPNMAGKSTYLRQTGLIVILAQIGSFVPADKAKIGIVDRLFTRVGASDNLAAGESTFLVEMNEVANILNNASNKSLILLDEVGRGTATYDGLSLAWAITEHIHNNVNIQARTIFATHYHELTELEKSLEKIENYHVEVKEFKDSIIFLRSIAKGSVDKSYGIQVAEMAGLPNSVILRATNILNQYIDKSIKNKSLIKDTNFDENTLPEEFSTLKEKLHELDINSTTPIEALNILDELQKEFK